MIAKALNHYKTLEKLGSGGMGEVYLAEDTRLHRKIALKVLPADMAVDEERRGRFEREVQIVAALNHPNIVTIYSVEEAAGLHFYTMEYVEGKTLEQLIPKQGYESKAFCDLAIPLVEAVAAAHTCGITHRDLKPANVMVSKEGRVKILDFGLAKLSELEEPDEAETLVASDALTRIGQIFGTVAYMSPEQAEGKPADERSDIFSLGIILYQMATGDSPFKGDTRLSLVSSILKDEPISVSDLNPSLPPRLARIIHHCLEKDPAHRYHSAGDLLRDLVELKRDVDSGNAFGPWSALSNLFRSRRRRNWTPVLLVAFIIATIAALSLGWWTFRSGPAERRKVADGRDSLAVFYFQNITGDDSLEWLRTGLPDMLVTDLSQNSNLRVLSTARLNQLLEEMGRREDQDLSFAVVQAVGRRARVGTAILGSFVKSGDVLRINVNLQDIGTGDIISSERIEGNGESALFSMVDDLTKRINRLFTLASLQEKQQDRDLASVTTDSVEAYRYYVEGIRHHEHGNDVEAIPLLAKAVELDPDFAMAQAKLSVAYGNSGQQEKAQQYAKKALEHIDRLTDRERYYIEGRYYSLDPATQDRAIRAYSRAVELFPDHWAARHNLALLYNNRKQFREAIAELEELRSQRMTFPASYGMLALAYMAVGEHEKGRTILTEYVEDHPGSAVGYSELGKYLLTYGDTDGALTALRRAQALDPDMFQPELWMALALSERWSEADQTIEAMKQLDPPSRWIAFFFSALQDFYLGRVENGFGTMDEVIRDLGGDPDLDKRLRSIRVWMAERAGRHSEAAQLAEALLSNESLSQEQRGEAHSVAALAYAALGDLEKSRKHADDFLASQTGKKSDSGRGERVFKGYLALFQGQLPDAERHFKEALALLPGPSEELTVDFANVWYGLAVSHWKQDENHEAARWFRTLAEAKTQRLEAPFMYVRSFYYLGKYYDNQKEMETAQAYYRKFLEYWGDGNIDRDLVADARSRLSETHQSGKSQPDP